MDGFLCREFVVDKTVYLLFAYLNGADYIPNCSLLYLRSNDMNSLNVYS